MMHSRNPIAPCLATAAATVCLISSGVATADGPFGLSMGMSQDDMGPLEPMDSPLLFMAEQVPVPSSHFDMYVVMMGEKAGLCAVRTITDPIDTNRFGHALTREFEKLQDALAERYNNEGTKVDLVMPGSLWDEPQDFMMGLRRDDRKLVTLWEANDNTAMAAANLSTITLEAKALTRSKGVLVLQYEFENMTQCREESRQQENQGL